MVKQYKSPVNRLVHFFEKSRDSWKTRAITYQKEKRQMKTKIRDFERSAILWKNKYSKLKEEFDIKKKMTYKKKSSR